MYGYAVDFLGFLIMVLAVFGIPIVLILIIFLYDEIMGAFKSGAIKIYFKEKDGTENPIKIKWGKWDRIVTIIMYLFVAFLIIAQLIRWFPFF